MIVFDTCRVEHAFELALRVGRVDCHHDSPDLPDADFSDEELRTVGKQKRDAVALANTETPQRGGERRACSVELAVRHGSALEQQRGLVGVIARERGQVVDERADRDTERA